MLLRGVPVAQAVDDVVNSIVVSSQDQSTPTQDQSALTQRTDNGKEIDSYTSSDDDEEIPRNITTNDDEEISQKISPTVRPIQSTPVSPVSVAANSDPQKVKSIVDELNNIRHPAHDDQTYLNHLRNISGGSPESYIASELNSTRGDVQQALQDILAYIEEDLKKKGLYAPRRPVTQSEPEPIVEPSPEPEPETMDDNQLIDSIKPYLMRGASPKVISSILSSQGIDVTPEKVKELSDQIESERISKRQKSVLNPDTIEDEEEVTENDIEDAVREYFKDGLSSPKEILKLLRKDHGINAGIDVVKSVLKDLKKSFKSYDDDRGVNVQSRINDDDEDDDKSLDDETDDENNKVLHKVVTNMLKSNPKINPGQIAQDLQKQGFDVDEVEVEDIIGDIKSTGKIKSEVSQFRNWLKNRQINN